MGNICHKPHLCTVALRVVRGQPIGNENPRSCIGGLLEGQIQTDTFRHQLLQAVYGCSVFCACFHASLTCILQSSQINILVCSVYTVHCIFVSCELTSVTQLSSNSEGMSNTAVYV